MIKLGEGVSTVTEQHGTLIAMMRFVSPPDIPQISVDSAIAASRVQRACGCRLRGYEVVTDRFGPDVIEVARGVPQHVADPKGYTAQIWVMDGDSNAYIARRATQLVKEARSAPGARVSIQITRGPQTVFSYALRPATGDSMAWALDGIRLPPGLSRDEHPPAPGGAPTAAGGGAPGGRSGGLISRSPTSVRAEVGTALGAPVSGSKPPWPLGKAITSRSDSAPASSIASRSSPKAMPACGGAPMRERAQQERELLLGLLGRQAEQRRTAAAGRPGSWIRTDPPPISLPFRTRS